MDESQPHIEERPATYKKKLQLWLMVSFGAVIALLLVLTVMNIFSKVNKGGVVSVECPDGFSWDRRSESCKQNAPDTEVSDRRDQFQQLVNERRPRVVAVENEGGKKRLDEAFSELQAGSSGGGVKNQGSPSLSAEEKALQKWEAEERLRALEAAKSNWGLQERSGKPDSVNSVAASRDLLQRPMSSGGSLEQRRAEVRRRIEEAQRLRERIATEGAAALSQSGSVAAADNRSQLNSVSNLFDPAPVNVVGYTKENKYNADIAGKIKVPPGTVLPTTLMWKSISDYTGGPLKAIVSHDVYDVTREYVIFPKGTEINISGVRAGGVNQVISSRMAFLVRQGVLPNGNVIDFTKAAAVDREGVSAIEDQVDHHFLAQFLGVAAYALVGSSTSYDSTGDGEGSYAGDVGESARNQFAPLARRYLNIVPTITIRPGQSFRVVIEEEMYVEPWSELYAKYVE